MNLAPWSPDWPAPPGVRALFTRRASAEGLGASAGPFGAFNLGDHVGDDPRAVAANRAQLQQALQARPVYLRQVHGTQVVRLAADTPDGTTADGAWTGQRGLVCTVLVADCLPILLTDTQGRRVAALHAGWRGLAGGVLERGLESFTAPAPMEQAQDAIKIESDEVLAWLGPCIGPRAFEVGAEVRQAFVADDARAAEHFAPLGAGKYLADLPALARQRLARWGVRRIHGNDSSAAWCTVGNETQYFSYRRDQQRLGGSGRMAACIWRV
ncbi:MAG: peptidoglycan editing factor PgeF [Burkholderiaceae bacterium]